MAEENNQGAEVQPQEDLTAQQGIPSVTGHRKGRRSSRKAGFMLMVISILLGAAITLWALSRYADEDKSQGAKSQEVQSRYTSSRELTVAPLPVKKEPELPEPVSAEQDSGPQLLAPVPLQPVPGAEPQSPESEQRYDANGNPLPTLEELKFAAPMMGSVQDNSQGQSAPTIPDIPQGDGSLTEPPEHLRRDLGTRLEAVSTPLSAARVMKNPSMLLSKGTVIECILESRVDTTVPGMTSCVIPRDVYSHNGRVLLIERGTKVVGEYQGSVQNGLARIFMLWTELRTPKGVVVSLNSPAADALGGAGMGGYVDYHWWKRFGNALLFSMVADGFQFLINTANSANNNNNVTYENTDDGIDEIIKEAMRQSGNIPPTLIKNQGERVSIFVARDLSFESVYRLSRSSHVR